LETFDYCSLNLNGIYIGSGISNLSNCSIFIFCESSESSFSEEELLFFFFFLFALLSTLDLFEFLFSEAEFSSSSEEVTDEVN